MAKKLNRSSHRERDYNRPEEEWLCGHVKNGKACPLGPTARGSCRGTGECMPILKGDRWHCTRADSFGGECEVGPSPDGKCGCSFASMPTAALFAFKAEVGGDRYGVIYLGSTISGIVSG